MDIKDVVGLSEPLTKLIDTLTGAGAALYEPTRIRKRAAAEADARMMSAQAEAEAMGMLARAESRIREREVRRQRNLEVITAKAVRELPAAVSGEAVDLDWTAAFLKLAEDVSNEEMQTLWAKILAGEVSHPGTFSRRTLANVGLLSRTDADLLTKFCGLVWHATNNDSEWWLHVMPKNSPDLLVERIRPEELTHLEAIGLISDVPSALVSTLSFDPGSRPVMEYVGRCFPFAPTEEEVSLTIVPLTVVGTELARIAGALPDEEYLSACLAHFQECGLRLATNASTDAG